MDKPKLLYIAPQNPYPPENGGKIGIYYPAKYLAKYFDLYFVTPYNITNCNLDISIEHFNNLNIKYFPFYTHFTLVGSNINNFYNIFLYFRASAQY